MMTAVAQDVLAMALSRQSDYSGSPGPEKIAAKRRAAEIVGNRPGARVLDVGGEGFYAEHFERRGMTLVALNRPDDMHDMGFDAEFDGVLAMHVLEHSPFPLLVLFLIRRALKPGGFLYVAVPRPDVKWIDHPAHFTVLDYRGWARLLDDAGFTITLHERGKFGPKSREERILCLA